jgi:hypothetical protein
MMNTSKLVLFAFVLITSSPTLYAQSQNVGKQNTAASRNLQRTDLTYELIPSAENTWGYSILADGKLLIRQTTIPGMQGTGAFKTKAAAKKIATLVISKIKNGEMPPTVSIDEMKKQKAI